MNKEAKIRLVKLYFQCLTLAMAESYVEQTDREDPDGLTYVCMQKLINRRTHNDCITK